VIPARPLLALLGAWTALGAAASFHAPLLPAWQWAGIALAGLAVMDAVAARGLPLPAVRREVMPALALGSPAPVTVELHNPLGFPRPVRVFDHHPPAAAQAGLPHALCLPATGWARLTYRLRPLARGAHAFGPVQIRIASPLRLWWRDAKVPVATAVRVYPNFAAVMKYSLLAQDRRLGDMGIRRRRRRGEGLEFHQLREYREGDALRQVDWKATARMGKLISRDYQEERDQRVVFLIDCGRRMRAADGHVSHFDHTLNAVLLLAHVALRQGDAVGLMTFSGPERWLAPRKSVASVNRLLNVLYDLQPGLDAPDYSAAATRLLARERRRALVVLVTNVRDEDTDDLLPALALLRRRHLVLLASLQETALREALATPVDDFDAALEHAATHHYLAHREAAHERLRRSGVYTVDAPPPDLPVHMVNRYLELKSAGVF